jgi:hypothetical protein
VRLVTETIAIAIADAADEQCDLDSTIITRNTPVILLKVSRI